MALTREHHAILREQGFVAAQPAIVAEAKDRTIVEIFSGSPGAVERAHSNPAVQELWKRYEAVCDYVPLRALDGTSLFAGFEAIN